MTTADSLRGAADLLRALAAPVRLAVVVQLGGGPRCVHELRDALREQGREVSGPLMSQHLKVLREAGLVSTSRRAQEIAYELRDSHVGHIVADAIRHYEEEH